MKIAIPADNNNIDSKVSQSFGRAPFFLIYDTETEKSEFLNNTAASLQGGAGIKAAQLIVDSKASALLAPRCGQNAADVLKSGNISIYKIEATSLMENITAFKENRLALLQDIHTGFHDKYRV
ncbi:MAG: dinitrogenase iron-molybdenum cofactor biosynthesis protein [Synergistaceae bacterium]|nr:dinitrogenase iron-molybdenum cofactor biosynthesis protein [Synergistaceae bacterium]